KHPLMRLYTQDPQVRALVEEIVGRYPGNDLIAGAVPHVVRSGDLKHLAVPVLIMNGEHDSAVRVGAGAELARALPDAQLAVIPDAGHLANLDNPIAYNQALGDFLHMTWSTSHAA